MGNYNDEKSDERRMLFIYTVSGTWADMSLTCPCLQLALIHIFKVHINTLELRCQMYANAVFHLGFSSPCIISNLSFCCLVSWVEKS